MISNSEFLSNPENIRAVETISLEVLSSVEPEEISIADKLMGRMLKMAENGETVIRPPTVDAGGFGNVDLITTVVVPIIVAVLTNLLTEFGKVGIEKLKLYLSDDKEKGKQASKLIKKIVEEQVEHVITTTQSTNARRKSKKIKETITHKVKEYLTIQ